MRMWLCMIWLAHSAVYCLLRLKECRWGPPGIDFSPPTRVYNLQFTFKSHASMYKGHLFVGCSITQGWRAISGRMQQPVKCSERSLQTGVPLPYFDYVARLWKDKYILSLVKKSLKKFIYKNCSNLICSFSVLCSLIFKSVRLGLVKFQIYGIRGKVLN